MKRWAALVLVVVVHACAKDDIPKSASGEDCQDASKCPVEACACSSGTAVLVQHCINFHCQTREEACVPACANFGGWTRGDAGVDLCNGDGECPSFDCRCNEGPTLSGGLCQDHTCGARSETCVVRCTDHMGWADCLHDGEMCEGDGLGCCAFTCNSDGHCGF